MEEEGCRKRSARNLFNYENTTLCSILFCCQNAILFSTLFFSFSSSTFFLRLAIFFFYIITQRAGGWWVRGGGRLVAEWRPEGCQGEIALVMNYMASGYVPLSDVLHGQRASESVLSSLGFSELFFFFVSSFFCRLFLNSPHPPPSLFLFLLFPFTRSKQMRHLEK